ncbi:hypothetical protein [Kitasatospora sp. NPDC057198]|uniref:hypothetical protein n=1 Tax=Kitasatospora sp. NPDC057198 TaxID=3346046 RepID=UPI00363F0557
MHLFSSDGDPLVNAFPAELSEEVAAVLAVMPAARLRPADPLPAVVEGRPVAVPGRIYHDEPPAEALASLSARQRQLLHCLYSRHHDGRVRQRHLAEVVGSVEPWAVPFVVRSAGEYVVEILVVIRDGLRDLAVPGSDHQLAYGRFIVDNPAFFARVQRQVVSYWNCYYRSTHASFRGYPGCTVLELLRSAASDRAGRRWPSLAPAAGARLDGFC